MKKSRATAIEPARSGSRFQLTTGLFVGIDDPLATTRGSMSKEVVPDLNDFALNPGEVANVGFSRSGTTLWLYPGNSPRSQVSVVTVGKKED